MTKETPRRTPREIALDVLMDITEKNIHSHKVMNKILIKYQSLEKQDRAFITRICEGTLERLITIDYIIDQYTRIKIKKMKPFIRNLLRLSVYQIKFMDQTPDFAVCNEAVNLAKKRGFRNLSGFVNGVLRGIIRDPKKIIFPDEKKSPVKFLSITYSMPEWLISNLLKQYDYPTIKVMLESFLKEKKTTIRCNLNQISADKLKISLEKAGLDVEMGRYLPYALHISKFDSLDKLEEFKKGYFQVQDESSMLVGQITDVEKKMKKSSKILVIDVCAAPGGKSLHIAEKLKENGRVVARDISEQKVSLIQENMKRLHIDNIEVQIHDALQLDNKMIEKADIVIADLPCSGLGVIGKKPDIKYNMNQEIQQKLIVLQRNILEIVQKYVKPGGTLLYSTCTVNKEENIDNVTWFLERFKYKLDSIESYLPETLKSESTKEGYIQLIPGIHDTDGFFIAKMVRV